MAAVEDSEPTPASPQWFAVIGTLPQSASEAMRGLASQVSQLDIRLQKAGLPAKDVYVYRTKISKSFALAAGRAKSQTDAQARVVMLRKAGFKDAFVQLDRGWIRDDSLR